MTRRAFSGPQWPDSAQAELLRTVLCDGDVAISAWRRWRALVPFDAIDGASLALMPLVGKRLRRLGYEDDAMPRIRGIARQTWLRNRVLVAAALSAYAALQADGIRTLALKGLVLSAAYVDDFSLRPMGDVDLLVRPSDLRAALDVLGGIGWASSSTRSLDRTLALTHEVTLARGHSEVVDLHFRSIEQAWGPRQDDGLWARTRPAPIDGVQVLSPSPTDLLFHILVHGVRGYPERNIRWVVDAAMILGSGDAIDWQQLERSAIDCGLTEATAAALAYLDRWSMPIPGETVRRLGSRRPSLAERVERDLGGRQTTALWYLRFDAANYLRKSSGWPVHRRLGGLGLYLGAQWGVPANRVPQEVITRSLRRLAHARTG